MNELTSDYVTKDELNLRLEVITDRQAQTDARNDERYSSMERLLDNKIGMIQVLGEKNLAQYQVIASEMKAEISEIRGDVKALSAQLNTFQTKMGMYMTLLGIGVSLALVLFQIFMK